VEASYLDALANKIAVYAAAARSLYFPEASPPVRRSIPIGVFVGIARKKRRADDSGHPVEPL